MVHAKKAPAEMLARVLRLVQNSVVFVRGATKEIVVKVKKDAVTLLSSKGDDA